MTSTSNLSASAIGRLESLPMCELLAYALYRKLSGSIVFETLEHDKSTLYVEQGLVTKVRTARPLLALGELLVAHGTLSQTNLARALAQATSERGLLGQALLEQRLVSASGLQRALREQLARRVAWVGSQPPSTSFAFFRAVDLLPEQAPLHGDPLRVIACALRAAPPSERIERVMARVHGHRVRLSAGVELERLELSPEQAAFAAAIRRAPEGLLPSADASSATPLRQLLYLLVLTRQLLLGTDKPVSGAPGAGRGSGLHSALDERSPASDDPSTRPTVPAPPPRADSAPPASTSWPSLPPSSLPPSSLPPSSLPPSSLPPSSLPPSSIPAPLSAGAALRAAQECIKRHQLDRAQALAEQLRQQDGSRVESQALLAWIQAQREDPRNTRVGHTILSNLNHAIRQEPNNPRLRYYRGQVLKRLGRTEDALKDFRFSARQDPSNLDAIRELRVHNMRSEPPPAKTSGVFAKFFGR
jgi:tetratricopeptide (TPR) repeat protein